MIPLLILIVGGCITYWLCRALRGSHHDAIRLAVLWPLSLPVTLTLLVILWFVKDPPT